MEHIDFRNIVGTSQEGENMLGKFLYFSLSNILVEKETMAELCQTLGMEFTGGSRVSVSDAFRSATGDIKERISHRNPVATHIYQVYCRDNKRGDGVLSRELVKETVGRESNVYEKLANIQYDKGDARFGYDNIVYDEDVDAAQLCMRAEELFELYQRCANRKQLETICLNYLRGLEATKISGNGHLYFVPRHQMHRVDAFEAFIEMVNEANKNDTRISANSFYIIDDEKQRAKMTEEFYSAVKREIQEYQDRASHFIDTGSQSPAILERWSMKIDALETKKRHYEDVLRRELDGLDDEFSTLQLLGQELSQRARSLRFRQAA
ncbi:MAG: DUF6744 family protein [Rikenellaceae bacterium]